MDDGLGVDDRVQDRWYRGETIDEIAEAEDLKPAEVREILMIDALDEAFEFGDLPGGES